MAYQIVWTKRAIHGYRTIVSYLEDKWTFREVQNFIVGTDAFFELLKEFPDLLPKTNHSSKVHRGALNHLTIITYRLKPRKERIEIINIRSSRQKPEKP